MYQKKTTSELKKRSMPYDGKIVPCSDWQGNQKACKLWKYEQGNQIQMH